MRRTILLLATFLAGLACSRPAPEVLATYRGGEVTVADFDRYVRSLPESGQVAPPGDREAWLRKLIRRLAVERVLGAGAEVREELASPRSEARRRWTKAALLAAAVERRLAGEARPAEEAVAGELAALGERQPVPLETFRHVFLRLDRAASSGEGEAIRRRGRELVRRARAGEDFAGLAREHSQSATAARGGLVENQRPGDLEATARRALAALEEGEVSDLVETRTGLHVFKLERRIFPRAAAGAREDLARRLAARRALAGARADLLADLRRRVEVSTADFPWRVGSFTVSETDLPGIAAGGPGRAGREGIVDRLLLAEEGIHLGLATGELDERVERTLRREAIRRAFDARRAEVVADVGIERLRPLYDARPSAFATRETADLDLIFVRQGRDAFTTQRGLEDRVAELRAGADFGDLARRISTGPGAAEGGALGPLPPAEWARLGPEVYRAVTALETGAISDPVYCTDRLVTSDPRTLRGGFAILRVRDRQPPRERTFEEALDDVRTAWVRNNARDVDDEVGDRILEEAGFEIVRLPDPDDLLL